MSKYCEAKDLDNVIENFTGDFFGTDAAGTVAAGTYVTSISAMLDERFRGMSAIPTVPVGTQMDGNYPETIKRLTALEAVRQKFISRIAVAIDDELQRRLDLLSAEEDFIYNNLESGKIVFEGEPSSQEGDISPAYKYSVSGIGNCYSNHDGYGGVYAGTDFHRYYRIKVVSTGQINSAEFQYSRDDGLGYEDDVLIAGTAWQELENALYVRFTGEGAGTDFVSGDTWRIHCVPASRAPESGNKARIKHFVRG